MVLWSKFEKIKWDRILSDFTWNRQLNKNNDANGINSKAMCFYLMVLRTNTHEHADKNTQPCTQMHQAYPKIKPKQNVSIQFDVCNWWNGPCWHQRIKFYFVNEWVRLQFWPTFKIFKRIALHCTTLHSHTIHTYHEWKQANIFVGHRKKQTNISWYDIIFHRYFSVNWFEFVGKYKMYQTREHTKYNHQ